MLYRFLFVAGITVGFMTPLVWVAYVSRPAPHAMQAPAMTIAKVAPAVQEPEHPTTKEVTASIPRSSLMPVSPRITETELPKPSAPPHTNKPARVEPAPSLPDRARVAQPHHTLDRYIPAVVHSYNGAHIITVCAALTVDEQLRAGCP